VKEKRMASLEDRLVASGCNLPLNQFQDSLIDVLNEMFRAWSVDELLLHPREEMEYCSVVRRKLECHDLPDELILRCALHRRKHPGD